MSRLESHDANPRDRDWDARASQRSCTDCGAIENVVRHRRGVHDHAGCVRRRLRSGKSGPNTGSVLADIGYRVNSRMDAGG